MKELSIEEKAKAYDKAIERAKKLHNEQKAQPFDVMLKVFPELKESEDDQIREWIIDDIKYNMNNEPLNNSEYKKKAEKAINWLEKQSDNNNQNWKPSKKQITAFEQFVRNIGESGYASPYDNNTKLLYSLLEQLKKLI
jgi:hypothetical protein